MLCECGHPEEKHWINTARWINNDPPAHCNVVGCNCFAFKKERIETALEMLDELKQMVVKMLEDKGLQPCGHPLSAIVTNGTTSYCGQCADDSLRKNIAAGVEL